MAYIYASANLKSLPTKESDCGREIRGLFLSCRLARLESLASDLMSFSTDRLLLARFMRRSASSLERDRGSRSNLYKYFETYNMI